MATPTAIQRTIENEGTGPLSAVAAISAFDGCPREVDIATFLVAFAAEQRVRGMLIGVVAGIAGSAALYLYLKSKGGK